MARKTIFVEIYEGYQVNKRSIKVDEYVDIDLAIEYDVIRSENENGTYFTEPTYAIWARPKESFLDPHGYIVKEADRQWLEHTPRQYGEQFLCRVKQLRVSDIESDKEGFLIEVTSGLDARAILRAEQADRILSFIKEHWWQITFVFVFLWWWLF